MGRGRQRHGRPRVRAQRRAGRGRRDRAARTGATSPGCSRRRPPRSAGSTATSAPFADRQPRATSPSSTRRAPRVRPRRTCTARSTNSPYLGRDAARAGHRDVPQRPRRRCSTVAATRCDAEEVPSWIGPCSWRSSSSFCSRCSGSWRAGWPAGASGRRTSPPPYRRRPIPERSSRRSRASTSRPRHPATASSASPCTGSVSAVRAAITVTDRGCLVGLPGNEVWIPREHLSGTHRATWTIDRVVEPDGLEVVEWTLGEQPVESSFRMPQGGALESAIARLLERRAA